MQSRTILIAITLLGLGLRVAFQVGRPFVGDEVGSLAILNETYATLVTTFKGQLTMNYYLVVLKVVYLYRSDDDDKPVPVQRPEVIALVVLTVGIIVVGTIFAPWWGFSDAAAAALS